MARQRSAPAPARSASSAAARPRPAASTPSAPPSARPAQAQAHAQAPHAPPHQAPAQAQPAASGGWWGSKSAAPAPAPVAPAAPPAMSQGGGGGGMLSGLMGSVVTGAAMGTGSAIAHRAVDSFMGPRETKVVHEHAPGPEPAAAAAPMSQDGGPCGGRIKEFTDCMSRNNGDMQACSFYFDAMQSCKAETQFRA